MVGIINNSMGVGATISKRVDAGSAKTVGPFSSFRGNLLSSESFALTSFLVTTHTNIQLVHRDPWVGFLEP